MHFFLKKFSLPLLIITDIAAFFITLVIALILRRQAFESEYITNHLIYFSLLVPLFIIILKLLDLYKIYYLRLNFNLFLITFNSIVYYLLFAILIFYLIPFFKIAPKTLLIIQSFFLWFLIYGSRVLIIKLFKRWKVIQPIAIIENNDTLLTQKIINELKKTSSTLKIFSLKPQSQDIYKLTQLIEKIGLYYIIYALPLTKNMQKILENLALNYAVTIQSVAEFYELIFQKIEIEHTPPQIILKDLVQKKPFYNTIKTIIDFLCGIIGFVVMVIIYPAIFLLIKLDDGGSIFYKQDRVGFKGKVFQIYKFRTMISNAQNVGPLTTEENDSRITKAGRFLRKLHLDEIPQCLNLLKGELSLVGPRPEQPSIVKEYENKVMLYSLRHSVKPGIVGWAQINYHYARNLADNIEKTKYDLYYIKNRNLFLDLEIIFKTLGAVLKTLL